ncbi:glycosyltransferase family 4 protein [bacterium]|nr:glycosyltransferase family 4 protein [bacterium]
MRILMAAEDFAAIGGIQELVDRLAVELLAMGHQVEIFSTPHVTPGLERTPATPAAIVYGEIPGRKAISLRHPERLWRQPIADELITRIRAFRPDLVNSHLWTWDKIPSVADAARRTKTPFVQSLYDSWGVGKLGRRAMRSLNRAAGLTALSRATRDYFARIARRARQAHIVFAGVDLAAAEAAHAYRSERPYILSAARIDLRQKALDLLIEAFALAVQEFPSVDLLIAGDGPDREKLAALVAARGLGARVAILGARPRAELWSLYKGARCFAMPSRMPEGLGLVFLEAMACGRPVIASASGGTPEIVYHGDNGLLVDRLEPDAWAGAIQTMLSDAAAREAMGRRGYAMVRERFSWRAVAERHLAAYNQVLSNEGGNLRD